MINPTLPLGSELSTSDIFFTVSSEILRQGGTDFTSNEALLIPQIASFDWDSLVEPPLPLVTPFQIKVQVERYTISSCIVDEGASVSIVSARTWRGMGSAKFMSIVDEFGFC